MSCELDLSWRRFVAALWLALVVTGLTAPSAHAQTPGVIFTRVATLGPSKVVFTGLILGRDGNFYGIMNDEEHKTGSIFKLTPDGVLTTLRQFTDADGPYPYHLFQGADGNFYGLASAASNPSGSTLHTIFRLTPEGELTTLYSFRDGSSPNSLLLAIDGSLYGTATPPPFPTVPGTSGTIFRLTLAKTFTSFSPFGTTATMPEALIQTVDGAFYGAASRSGPAANGGPRDQGELFRFEADGSVTQFKRFNKLTGSPFGLLQGSDGNFYNLGSVPPVTFGTSPVYQITLSKTAPTGQRSVFVVSAGDALGLTQGKDGNFYLVTKLTLLESGATVSDIACIAPNGTECVIYRYPSVFDSDDISKTVLPISPVIQADNGSFYGLAASLEGSFLYRLDVTAPTVTLSASAPTVAAGSDGRGKFLLSLSGPWPDALTVAYAVKGTAQPDVDYKALSGTVTIPAGQTHAVIRVKPAQSMEGADRKTVKLTLAPGAGYTVGAATTAKVTITER